MIKATTSHGTYYLIDEDNNRAMRVKGEGRNAMWSDDEWFDYIAAYPFDYKTFSGIQGEIREGYSIFFLLNHAPHDYRISTDVVSIEEV